MEKNNINKTFKVSGMTCINCSNRINEKLKNLDGIASADASFTSGNVVVSYNESIINEGDIKNAITSEGYEVAQGNVYFVK